jgi:hypothetical protein
VPIAVDLLTTQALAREPHQDAAGWSEGFAAGVARALEVLGDGGHLIPDPLVCAELEVLSDDAVAARGVAHRRLLSKAGAPGALVAVVLLRRVLAREQPAAVKLVRVPDDGGWQLVDADDDLLDPANDAVARVIDTYANDLTHDDLTWGDLGTYLDLT